MTISPFAATRPSRRSHPSRRSLPRASLSLLGLLSMLALGSFFQPAVAQQIVPPAITAIACAYNTSPPTITTNFFGLVQCDSTGHLLTSLSNTSAAPLYVVPGTGFNPWPVADSALLAAVQSPIPAGTNGIGTINSQYPTGAVPITASATGTSAATTATLTNVTGHTTYICGFSIRANATAAATGNATVTGTISGTLNFTQWTALLASGLGVTEEIFTPCIPANAVSTSISAISAAPGTGGTVSVAAWGYSL